MKNKYKTNRKHQVSLKYKMILMFITSVLIVIGAMFLITLPQTKKELETSVEAHLSDFIVSHSDKIKKTLDDMSDYTEMLEQQGTRLFESHINRMNITNEGNSADKKHLQDLNLKYETQMEAMDHEMKRIIGEAKYEDLIIMTGLNGLVITSSDESMIGTKLEEDEYDKISTEQGKLTLRTFWNEETKKLTAEYARTIFLNGDPVGFIIYRTNEKMIGEIAQNFTLTNIPEPRLYILNAAGMYISHQLEERIGTICPMEMFNPVLEAIRQGTYSEEGVQTGTYESDGQPITVSYIRIPGTNWILGVNALDHELYKDSKKITNQFIANSIVILIGVGVFIFFSASRFTKPIENVSKMIERLGKLDFTIDTKDASFRKICDRTDEIGAMGQSVEAMITVVKERIQEIMDCSEQVNQAAIQLKSITTEISEKASDTSATTEELSAGMEETTASAEIITSDVQTVQGNVAAIKEQISGSAQFTTEIMQRANALKEEALKSEANIRATFDEIKKRGSIAMEQSKATVKINELTKVIMDIAAQTSLLALNASIEAARAGDAGRGFAVVADEIGNLAHQSSDTVAKITDIVDSVNAAVSSITECLSDSQSFVEENVYSDYAVQLKTLDTYNQDASSIQKTMNEVEANTSELYSTMSNVTDSIQAINQTMQDAAVGVTDIAERNNDIGDLTARSNEMVKETNQIADQLEKTVAAFKLK